jgi:uncharacterized repeat protein (TIGR01451 family)
MTLTTRLFATTAALAALVPAAVGSGFGNRQNCCPTVAPPPRGPYTMPHTPGYPPPEAGRHQPCPPLGPPAPLLAMKVLAPDGVSVTLLPGTPAARTFPAPVTVGFRPGYAYRFALGNLPGRPGETLYPTLEVRGSIVPRPGMNYMDYFAPLLVTRGDIDKAFAGAVVAKVVYLEDPTKALPQAATPDAPIEVTDSSVEEAVKAAMGSGRLVAVLRLGDRAPDAEELARATVANTILFPGEQALAAAAAPPLFAWWGQPLFDPILGPRLATEECLTDGGDKNAPLGIGPLGRVGGLDPTDVAASYTVAGKRRVTTSNEVCVCAPRFVIRRADLLIGGLHSRAGLDGIEQVQLRQVASMNAAPGAIAQREKAVTNLSQQRPGITVMVNGVAQMLGLSRPQIIASRAGLAVIGSTLEVEEITSPSDLTVTKSVDPAGPVKPGDEVTFTLRYRNGLLAPVTDLVLSDSLSGRLEYVPGSAQSDRPVNVSTLANPAGSVEVRFEIPGPIPPGQSGTVKFRAKVR